ncbi:MAG: hypothetical protein JWO11_3074 [Nocardioides sp.]|nr:hypothetical protein [Nocardioides sp.]
MSQRVVLHVGLMKSGTSYLQERLFLNRDRLGDQGVLLPGTTWRDQVLAVQDVLGRQRAARASAGKWSDLLEQVSAHAGVSLVSMEFLGPATPARIATVTEAFAGSTIEAVVTVRDLGRVVPAMWQERLKNGGVPGWREYVDSLPARGELARWFWRQHGAGRIVQNWVAELGAERVTVVTVPPPGADPGLLWSRFCEAAGIDGSSCLDVQPANTSLDVASALLLRAINLKLTENGPIGHRHQLLLKFGLAKRTLATNRGGCPIGFEPPPWLLDRASEIREKLAASGVRVVGDLADLVPAAVAGEDPDLVTPEAQLEAAVDTLAKLTTEYSDSRSWGRPADEPDEPDGLPQSATDTSETS